MINSFIKKNKYIKVLLKKNLFDVKILRKYFSLFFLMVLVLFFTSQSSRFLTFANMGNILQQSAVLVIVAMGGTFIILSGSIDLSTGSVAGLAAVITAGATKSIGLGAIPIGIIVGILCGMVNGFTFAKLKIPSFIATLGMMIIARGLIMVYTRGRPIPIFHEPFLFLGQGRILKFPVIIFISIFIFIFSLFILKFTVFGRSTIAIGGGEKVSRLSGIKVDKMKFLLYTFAGFFTGIGGVAMAARLGAGTPRLGEGLELDIIASVVLGGTPLTGGIGNVAGTIIGALIMITLGNGLNIIGVSSYTQLIVKGIVLIIAVVISIDRQKIGIIK